MIVKEGFGELKLLSTESMVLILWWDLHSAIIWPLVQYLIPLIQLLCLFSISYFLHPHCHLHSPTSSWHNQQTTMLTLEISSSGYGGHIVGDGRDVGVEVQFLEHTSPEKEAQQCSSFPVKKWTYWNLLLTYGNLVVVSLLYYKNIGTKLSIFQYICIDHHGSSWDLLSMSLVLNYYPEKGGLLCNNRLEELITYCHLW